MVALNGQISTDIDEILVKGEDGKFYVLRGDTLVPADAGQASGNADPELDRARERASVVPKQSSPTDLVQSILQAAAVSLSDEQQKARLEKAITLFLKDLRNQLETKETLLRSAKVGGVGLTEKDAETLLRRAEGQRKEWMDRFEKQEARKTEKFIVPAPARPLAMSSRPEESRSVVPPKPVEKQQEAPRESPKQVPTSRAATVAPTKPREVLPPVNLPTPSYAKASVDARALTDKSEGRPTPVVLSPIPRAPVVDISRPLVAKPVAPATPKPVLSQTPLAAPPKPASPQVVVSPKPVTPPAAKPAGRPLVADVIAPVQRAVGPIDELRYDLPSFRRLGSGGEGTKKILEKITFLLKQSWKDGLAAADAWRRSPVMELVMSANRESIMSNRPVSEVIAGAIRDGKPMVTVEEWKQCMEFVRKIDQLLEH